MDMPVTILDPFEGGLSLPGPKRHRPLGPQGVRVINAVKGSHRSLMEGGKNGSGGSGNHHVARHITKTPEADDGPLNSRG